MADAHVVQDATTPAERPPMRESNEAEPDQLDVARTQGDAYGEALEAMAAEDGAVTARAGNYVVAFVNEQAEGMYAPADGGGLEWREAPEEANAHLEVAVADGADGRFVPGLDVTVTVLDGDRELFTHPAPFLWHPFLHHYGFNARIPSAGPFTVRVRIEPPAWMRHDPVNGRRYADPVEVTFADVEFEPGTKPSPDATPRGEPTAFAG
ncbi:iron transporter [Aquipuribacter sp. SD81]|uniref:iron transporter n=1 Tax=Aquipuribacter sp. SD81 TaxID=3127703 RepID=UPI00301A14B0